MYNDLQTKEGRIGRNNKFSTTEKVEFIGMFIVLLGSLSILEQVVEIFINVQKLR